MRRQNIIMVWINYKENYDIVSQTWMSENMKNIRPSQKFIAETGKPGKWNDIVGGKIFAGNKIQWDNIRGNLLLPLLLFIATIPPNYILRKCNEGYEFTKSQENINYLMYMDTIELFAKNEKNGGHSYEQ